MRLLIVWLAMTAAAAGAAAAAAESRPLPADQCRTLARDFARAIGREPALAVTEPGAAKLPYADHLPRGRACVFTAQASGRKAAARAGDALAELASRLRDRGWEDSADLATDGGDDAQTGLRKGAARLAFAIEERPAPACRALGPRDRCRAPDGAHGWVFRAAAYEQ